MNVICYGDSNTYGYDPRSYFGERYDACWVEILAEKTGWNVVNDGMNGRRISKRPIDLPKDADILIIMLGDNDLLNGLSAAETARRMKAFLNKLSLPRDRILLIAPPPMKWGEWVPNQELIEASKALALAYQFLAEQMGIGFVDAGKWNISLAYDGVHFTEDGHRVFGENLSLFLEEIGGRCYV